MDSKHVAKYSLIILVGYTVYKFYFDDSAEGENIMKEPIKNAMSLTRAAVFGTKYDELIRDSADANGISPKVLYNLLKTESAFREDIISGKTRSRTGALGIAQFMPATASEMGIDPLDPKQAIPACAEYLASLIKKFGDVGGVAAYNWGMGNVSRKGLANAPDETVSYVKKILGVNLRG